MDPQQLSNSLDRRVVIAAGLGEVPLARRGIRNPASGVEDGFFADLLRVHAKFSPGQTAGRLSLSAECAPTTPNKM
jgi:hypothetical protein